ncbi:hypothetical protein ACO2Q3_24635 [Caulobacter sp. KR2-114]|jgi:hypothetical protein|uniref:hypothetical protein n=1 Tax=Caulobacter sp. KR2-114 TaxID=3400912 RepID=UPI003C03D0CA
MVSIAVGTGGSVFITGHGVAIADEFELSPGITLTPEVPRQTASFGSTVSQLPAHAALLVMETVADFSIRIEHSDGGEALAVKAWNALWLFSLLSLAFRAPIIPLYSYAKGRGFAVANRNLMIRPRPKVLEPAAESLAWAAASVGRFDAVLADRRFRTAQRYYNNAHDLFDDDAKIMLLWAGIEGLLGVDAEISRRIALHAAILLDGTPDEKMATYQAVKKAYAARSKVVHGVGMDQAALSSAYDFASGLLVKVLRKIVDLGRMPTMAELDRVAASGSLSS